MIMHFVNTLTDGVSSPTVQSKTFNDTRILAYTPKELVKLYVACSNAGINPRIGEEDKLCHCSNWYVQTLQILNMRIMQSKFKC